LQEKISAGNDAAVMSARDGERHLEWWVSAFVVCVSHSLRRPIRFVIFVNDLHEPAENFWGGWWARAELPKRGDFKREKTTRWPRLSM
jgi:hypothetical protein